MRRMLIALTLAVLAAAVFAEPQALIRSVSGRVEVLGPGGTWNTAAAEMKVLPGATISTGFQSEATVEVGAHVLRVGPLTRMRIDELVEREGAASSELFLRVGRIRAEVRSTGGLKQDFTVRSPISTAAVRGTSFDYDGVNLDVDEGVVRLTNLFDQGTTVGRGEKASAGRDQPPVGGEASNEREATVRSDTGPLPFGIRPPAKLASVTVTWVQR